MNLPALGPRPSFAEPLSDREFALRVLRMIARDPDPREAICFVYPGAPIPKGRPRHTRKGITYTPARTVKAERDLAVAFQCAVRTRPMLGPVAFVALFFQADHRRSDTDNLMKLAMDAATQAGVWQDDSQVVAQMALLEHDPANPRTVIAIAPALSGMRRMPQKESPCRSKQSPRTSPRIPLNSPRTSRAAPPATRA